MGSKGDESEGVLGIIWNFLVNQHQIRGLDKMGYNDGFFQQAILIKDHYSNLSTLSVDYLHFFSNVSPFVYKNVLLGEQPFFSAIAGV